MAGVVHPMGFNSGQDVGDVVVSTRCDAEEKADAIAQFAVVFWLSLLWLRWVQLQRIMLCVNSVTWVMDLTQRHT